MNTTKEEMLNLLDALIAEEDLLYATLLAEHESAQTEVDRLLTEANRLRTRNRQIQNQLDSSAALRIKLVQRRTMRANDPDETP